MKQLSREELFHLKCQELKLMRKTVSFTDWQEDFRSLELIHLENVIDALKEYVKSENKDAVESVTPFKAKQIDKFFKERIADKINAIGG